MLFEDDKGTLLTDKEVDNLSPWEIESRRIHVHDQRFAA